MSKAFKQQVLCNKLLLILNFAIKKKKKKKKKKPIEKK